MHRSHADASSSRAGLVHLARSLRHASHEDGSGPRLPPRAIGSGRGGVGGKLESDVGVSAEKGDPRTIRLAVKAESRAGYEGRSVRPQRQREWVRGDGRNAGSSRVRRL